jgi:hypothetical protein
VADVAAVFVHAGAGHGVRASSEGGKSVPVAWGQGLVRQRVTVQLESFYEKRIMKKAAI